MGKRKKKRPATGKPTQAVENRGVKDEEMKVVEALVEAFSLASIEEATAAVREAEGDANEAAEILAAMIESESDCTVDSSSVSAGSTSGSSGMDTTSSSSNSEGIKEYLAEQAREIRGGKGKRFVAATGTVSTFLGKEYVKRGGGGKMKAVNNTAVEKEEAEQFLCSMLGDEPGLSLAVVRDVLCCYAYDVEKALEALLHMCGSVGEQSTNGSNSSHLATSAECGSNAASDSTSESSKKGVVRHMGYNSRDFFWGHDSSDSILPSRERSSEIEISQAVLESLYKISKSPDCDPNTMNWRNVVKKLESIGGPCDTSFDSVQLKEPAKGDEYQFFRKSATQYWDSTRSYYQKAASAYSTGERSYAAHLSDQGKVQAKKAREADEKASQQIFEARNKGIGNVITIDLHGQHVKQAMKMLKLHLLFGSYACSIQTLRVITGSGSHGLGKSKIKQSVIDLLKREGINWTEENIGTVLIKLSGQREFSFVDSDSDD